MVLISKLVPVQVLPGWNFRNGLSIDMGIMLDPISVMMLVVVTFISLMVHIYSLGIYERGRTIPHLLCLSGAVYFFHAWTGTVFQYFPDLYFLGTGGCFIFPTDWILLLTNHQRVAAAKKAFIVTRFADLGFLIGILILSY